MNKFFVLTLALVLLAGAFATDGEMMMNAITEASNGTVMANTSVGNMTSNTMANVSLNTSAIMGDITGLGIEAANDTSASLGNLAFNGSMLAGSVNNASNWIDQVVNDTIGNFNVTNPTWNSTFEGLDANISSLIGGLSLSNLTNFSTSNLTSDLSNAYNSTSGFFGNETDALSTLLSNTTGAIDSVASEIDPTQAAAAGGFIAYEAGAFLGVLAGNLANDANTGDFSQIDSQLSTFEMGAVDAADTFYNGTNLNSSIGQLINALNTSAIASTISGDISDLTGYASNVTSYASNLTNITTIPTAYLTNLANIANVSNCFNSSCMNQSQACMADMTCSGLMMNFSSCLTTCGLPANYSSVAVNATSSLGSVSSLTTATDAAAMNVASSSSGFLSALSSAAIGEAATLLGGSSTSNLSTSSVSCFQGCFNPSNYANNTLFTAYLSCGVQQCA